MGATFCCENEHAVDVATHVDASAAAVSDIPEEASSSKKIHVPVHDKLQMVSGDTPPIPSKEFRRWSELAQGPIATFCEASSFLNFAVYFNTAQQQTVVSPEHCIITFRRSMQPWLKNLSALLSLRLLPEALLPPLVPIGRTITSKDGTSCVLNGDFIEFELLAAVSEVEGDLPLKMAAGPFRINPTTQQREFIRVDLGHCLRDVVIDISTAPGKPEQRYFRHRWWICVALLKYVCTANDIDVPVGLKLSPLQWVISLAAEGTTSSSCNTLSTMAPASQSDSQKPSHTTAFSTPEGIEEASPRPALERERS